MIHIQEDGFVFKEITRKDAEVILKTDASIEICEIRRPVVGSDELSESEIQSIEELEATHESAVFAIAIGHITKEEPKLKTFHLKATKTDTYIKLFEVEAESLEQAIEKLEEELNKVSVSEHSNTVQNMGREIEEVKIG